jgi:hypothetical protein
MHMGFPDHLRDSLGRLPGDAATENGLGDVALFFSTHLLERSRREKARLEAARQRREQALRDRRLAAERETERKRRIRADTFADVMRRAYMAWRNPDGERDQRKARREALLSRQ